MMDLVNLGLALSLGQAPAVPQVGSPIPAPSVIVAPQIGEPALPVVQPLPRQIVPLPSSSTFPPRYTIADAPKELPPDAKKLDAEPKKNGNGNGDEKKEDEEEKKEPTKYFFMKALEGTRTGNWLEERNITIMGWTQMSYTGSSASRTNLPITFNDGPNDFQLNQNYLQIFKSIDTEKKETQFGWRTDFILPGTDARFTVPRGLFDNQLRNGDGGGPRSLPIDIYQVYGELFLPNLGVQGSTVRIGRFATHCEYEITQGADTPFLTRSYTFQYNPFTHTGVWVITPLNDDWTASYGLAVGSDNFIDPANRTNFIGQLKWAPKEGKTQVLFNTVLTNPRFNVAENFAFYNVYNMQVIHKATDKLTYVLDTTYSHGYDFPGTTGYANWFGIVNWFQYQVNDKVASNLRLELFDDFQGVRTGFEGLYFAATYGLTYAPQEWLLLRPFVRFDYNEQSRPFAGDKDLYTGGLDVIVRW